VQGSQHVESLQYHQRQGALQNVGFFFHAACWVSNRSMPDFF
jgi:hypothetical protein